MEAGSMFDQIPNAEKWRGRDVTLFDEQEMKDFLADCQAVETPEQRLIRAFCDVIAQKDEDPARYGGLINLLLQKKVVAI
jgi:hypothetical protein